MIEFMLGCIVGGSITFMVSTIFISSRLGQLVFKRGQSVTYTNRLKESVEAVVVDDAHSSASYVILSNSSSILPFIVAVDHVD
jgi:hypothetical protein